MTELNSDFKPKSPEIREEVKVMKKMAPFLKVISNVLHNVASLD